MIKLSLRDITSVAKGDDNRNPDADLNKDGIVDIIGIVMVAIHFGETC